MRYCETIRSAHGDELMAVRACDVVRVRDGLIVSIDEYAIPQANPTPATGYSRNQISFALLRASELRHDSAGLDAVEFIPPFRRAYLRKQIDTSTHRD